MKPFVFSLFFIFPFVLFAQYPQWNVDYYAGKILRHTSKLKYKIPAFSQAVEISYWQQTTGQKAWARCQHFPHIGLSFYAIDLGDNFTLGTAYGLLPKLSARLWNTNTFDLRFQLGSGVAYLSRTYDVLENPLNNAIGSHWNNITTLHFNAHYLLSKKWTLRAGFGLLHLSNGSAKLPNLGINYVSASLGIQYRPRAMPARIQAPCPPLAHSRWSAQVFGTLAFNEIFGIGGPRYPIYTLATAVGYYLTPYHRLLLGAEYEFNRGVYDFGVSNFYFTNRREARVGASRWMLSVADELFFGSFSIFLQVGVYWKADFRFLSFPIYNRLGFRYYLPPIGRPRTRFFLGIHLKSHRFAAEQIALGIGASIN